MPSKADVAAWQTVVGAKPDGDFGPKSLEATIAWARAHGHLKPLVIAEGVRGQVVAIAKGELGLQPPHKYYATAAPMYMGTKPNEKSWCGVFALWCLREAGLTTAVWKDGVGFVGPLGMPIVSLPQPGDIAYYSRNQHYAIVVAVNGDGTLTTVDGNSMQAPLEGVTEKFVKITAVTAFYSIRNLVAANV